MTTTADACSLVSTDQVADITGITVANTLPQGVLTAISSCAFGGVERPPVLQLITTRGPGAKEAYESNKDFDYEAVSGFSGEAVWVIPTNLLAILDGDDYLAVKMADTSLGDKEALKGMAVRVAEIAQEGF